MPVIQPTPWNDLVGEMQTGDLIMFSGTSSESEWIKLFTLGEFSHSTMIYRPDPSQPPLMWQEAPDAIVADPHTGTSHGGAQLGDALGATEVITNQYKDVPYYVKLNWDSSVDPQSGHPERHQRLRGEALRYRAADGAQLRDRPLLQPGDRTEFPLLRGVGGADVSNARPSRHVTPAELVLPEQFWSQPDRSTALVGRRDARYPHRTLRAGQWAGPRRDGQHCEHVARRSARAQHASHAAEVEQGYGALILTAYLDNAS